MLPRILGHAVVGEEPHEHFLIGDGPCALTEDVDEGRARPGMEHGLLLGAAPARRIEDERVLLHSQIICAASREAKRHRSR
ncbi:hypothetical protein Sm713_79140 [Streptomyces sp. TS71-3]|nr:hypothetical protein Sm713_79140 [Streptomyces sp. TS71-3]